MPQENPIRLKLLKLVEILRQETDEDHPLTIMAPENFTPKYPDGQYYQYFKTGAFSFVGCGEAPIDIDDIRVGIVGQGGEYVPPID